MRVIFLEDIAGTADAGEVKDVKNGFARNYLLPQRLAVAATPDQLQRLRSIQKAAGEKRLKVSQDMAKVAEAMEGMNLTLIARIGPTGRLFGSVTGRQIAEELNRQTEREVDHRNVLLGEAIREPGDFPVTIRLYRNVTAQITVSVVPEGYLEEQAAKEAAGEVAHAIDEPEVSMAEVEAGSEDIASGLTERAEEKSIAAEEIEEGLKA